MLTKNIKFKNFKIKKNSKKIKKELKNILLNRNAVLNSLSTNYKNSYNKKIILKFKKFSNISDPKFTLCVRDLRSLRIKLFNQYMFPSGNGCGPWKGMPIFLVNLQTWKLLNPQSDLLEIQRSGHAHNGSGLAANWLIRFSISFRFNNPFIRSLLHSAPSSFGRCGDFFVCSFKKTSQSER